MKGICLSASMTVKYIKFCSISDSFQLQEGSRVKKKMDQQRVFLPVKLSQKHLAQHIRGTQFHVALPKTTNYLFLLQLPVSVVLLRYNMLISEQAVTS